MSERHELILHRALQAKLGIEVFAADPTATRGQLYRVKRQHPEFDCLSISIPKKPKTIYILKKDESNGKAK